LFAKNDYLEHKREMLKLKSYLIEKKNSDFVSENTVLDQYKCSIKCLTVNKIQSRNRLEENELSFFITDSRNKFKKDLHDFIIQIRDNIRNESLNIQISGNAGMGKSYTLADYTVIEKLKNFENKENIVLYYHFNQLTNNKCVDGFLLEIFVSLYPLIENDLEEFISSKKEMEIEAGSLLHLLLKIFDIPKYEQIRKIELINEIFLKIKSIYPEKNIIVILDQINESSKNKKKEKHLEYKEYEKQLEEKLKKLYSDDEAFKHKVSMEINGLEDKMLKLMRDDPTILSERFFELFKKIKQNIILIVCASNNNEFTRSNILENTLSKFFM